MTIDAIDASQRTAARVVGLAYLIAMATAVLGFAIRGLLMVPGNAAQTARLIADSAGLFRLSLLSDLATYITDIVLITALYVVFRPVDRNVALVAVFWRLMETAVLTVATLNGFAILRALSGADFLAAFEVEALQAMTRLSLQAYGDAYRVGFVFLGLGSALFSWLWLRSRYVPRALAFLGIFSSLLLAACNLAFMLAPGLPAIVGPAYMAPMGVFEVGMGFWLLFRGLRSPVVAVA
jgi:hypothetical protein